jgi:hypothetical protein
MKNNATYTAYSSPELCDKFWCFHVSHHHYWFDNYDDLLDFMNSDLFDVRMRISSPAKSVR